MTFDVSRFIGLRPFVYHLTDRANVPALVRSRSIRPAAELIRCSGATHWLSSRRASMVSIEIDGETVVLKDQRPLRFANAALADGWTPEDFVRHLNEHVFFWPGSDHGPVKHGERLFECYASDSPAVLRAPTAEVIAANPTLTPLFCAFNSGAPRMQRGQRVPRGPDLFLPAGQFPRSAGDVVELVFRGEVRLTESTSLRLPGADWQPLA